MRSWSGPVPVAGRGRAGACWPGRAPGSRAGSSGRAVRAAVVAGEPCAAPRCGRLPRQAKTGSPPRSRTAAGRGGGAAVPARTGPGRLPGSPGVAVPPGGPPAGYPGASPAAGSAVAVRPGEHRPGEHRPGEQRPGRRVVCGWFTIGSPVARSSAVRSCGSRGRGSGRGLGPGARRGRAMVPVPLRGIRPARRGSSGSAMKSSPPRVLMMSSLADPFDVSLADPFDVSLADPFDVSLADPFEVLPPGFVPLRAAALMPLAGCWLVRRPLVAPRPWSAAGIAGRR